MSEIINLSDYEKHLKFLEGTGSIVFDHLNRIAYVALSARSHIEPLQKLTELLNYQAHTFHTADYAGNPIYHTNVMMSVGNHFAVVCTSSMPNENERNALLAGLENNSKELIEITGQQMVAYAGNMLEVSNSKEEPLLLLSETAIKSLTPNHVKSLEKYGSLVPVSIPVIERIGGGSIRCMVAEIFLPESSKFTRFNILQPQSNSDFEKYYGLRWRVLREPWNQPQGSERDDLEPTSIHRMAVAENGLVAGVARLHYLNETEAQIRFMAVAPEFQGKGVGKILVYALELEAKKSGRKRVFLQAREKAVPFYLRLGYSIVEKTFLLYEQIQHFSMEKEV
ncbi:MAG: GNAT family N-acetyltransferase [Bacteroidetes bacterium]|nr:GNAT family N-acetyltransferase [Bacteroidota bacterium]